MLVKAERHHALLRPNQPVAVCVGQKRYRQGFCYSTTSGLAAGQRQWRPASNHGDAGPTPAPGSCL
eukprot:530745-Pyramimonas_sp.AAC.1